MTQVLDFSRPHVLRNEGEYEAAIAEIEELLELDPEPASAGYERLEFLSVLAEAYEETSLLAPEVTPQQAVDFMLEQRNLSRADLASWLGGRSRVSEFYSGKRRLSLRQIEALQDKLGLPADLLLA